MNTCEAVRIYSSTPKKAAGIIVISSDKEIFLGFRSGKSGISETWASPGGKVEANETFKETAIREFHEETGYKLEIDKLQNFHTEENLEWIYITYIYKINKKFDLPQGDGENTAFGWFKLSNLPKQLHPGFEEILPELKEYINSQAHGID